MIIPNHFKRVLDLLINLISSCALLHHPVDQEYDVSVPLFELLKEVLKFCKHNHSFVLLLELHQSRDAVFSYSGVEPLSCFDALEESILSVQFFVQCLMKDAFLN